MTFVARPITTAADADARDRQLASLMKQIEALLPYPMGKTERPVFETALTMHLNGLG